jgi:hypothetical protein
MGRRTRAYRKSQVLSGKESRQNQDLMNKRKKSNTKHKENGILVNEINERFGLQKRIDQSILKSKE